MKFFLTQKAFALKVVCLLHPDTMQVSQHSLMEVLEAAEDGEAWPLDLGLVEEAEDEEV